MKNPIKESYSSIMTPQGYDEMIKSAVARNNDATINDATGKVRNVSTTRRRQNFRKIAAAAAALCLTFVTVLNCNPSFADQVKNVPVVGNLFGICTFVEEDYGDKVKSINVTEPEIELYANTTLEKKINREIQGTINEEIADATARADEYYEIYLNTGGSPEDYIPLEVVVDYETKCVTDNYASFMVYKYETLASAYRTSRYYNIDLKSGKQVSLKDMLGSNYKKIVTTKIKADIDKMPADEKSGYFDDVDISRLITENRSFYVSPDEKSVVVVFNKYEIAIGAMGELEFEIPIPQ